MYRITCDGAVLWSPESYLADRKVIEPKLTMELNKAGKLTFTLPPGNSQYNNIQLMKSTVALWDGNECIFLGRPLSIKRDFWNMASVTCEGALAWLNSAVVRPYTVTTAEELLARVAADYASQAGTGREIAFTIPATSNALEEDQKTGDGYSTCLDVLLKIIVPALGDDAAADLTYAPGTAAPVTLAVRTSWDTSGQTIRFGKNLLDIDSQLDGGDLYTGILPLGARVGEGDNKLPLTIARVNDGSDILWDNAAASAFGKIVKKVSFSDIGPGDGKTETQAAQELKDAAAADLEDHIGAAMTLELTALDLSLAGVNVSALRLGQMSRVVSPPHNLDATYQLRRIAPLELENPEKSKYVFGATAKTLIASTNAGMMQTNATASKALQTATGAADAASAAQAAIPDLSRQTDTVTISSGTYSSGRLVKSGQVVTMSIQTTSTPVTTSWATIGSVPAGFRPTDATPYGIGSANWDKIIRIRVNTSGNLQIRGGEAISSATITAQLSWVI